MIADWSIDVDWAPWVALATVAIVFVGFAREWFSPQTTALIGVATLVALGPLTTDDMLSVLSNSAPATIAAIFILGGALTRTGALDALSRIVRRGAVGRPKVVVVGLLVGAMALSAFINNTPVIMVLIPVTIGLADSLGAAPSRLLIPLSYATILGGMCTLFGTSTNLLVDGVVRSHGLDGFGVFEITPIGLAAAAVGMIYLAVVGPRFLPSIETPNALVSRRAGSARFMIETLIGHDSPLIGQKLVDSRLYAQNTIRVIDVLRGDDSLRRNIREVKLQEGDRLVLRADAADLTALRQDGLVGLSRQDLETVQSRSSAMMEALVAPGSPIIGRRLLQLRLRRRYGVYVIAGHRRGQNLAAYFETTPLETADTILLEGAPEDLRRVAEDYGFIQLSEPPERNFRPEKAPIAIATLIGMVVLASFGVLPIAGAAVIAAAVVLAARCIDGDEALSAIDGGLLLLIYAMLAMGKALQTSGAADLIVFAVEPILALAPLWITLFCIYMLTSTLTELVTNNAVAIIMTPIVMNLAVALGQDPRLFAILVMIAASASFATPIGYQTNTLVYAAGGYRFLDFFRIGAPLNLIVGTVTVIILYLFYL
jgi:di/tricarboxylate transporter